MTLSRRRFERTLAAEGWTPGEVLDRDRLLAAIPMIGWFPPVAAHRRVDGGHVWVAAWPTDDIGSTTGVARFDGMGFPHIVARAGLLGPPTDPGMPAFVFGTLRPRWRVFTHYPDWAALVGAHLLGEPALRPAAIEVTGAFTVVRIAGRGYHPGLGDLTLAMATMLQQARVALGPPRLPAKRAGGFSWRGDP